MPAPVDCSWNMRGIMKHRKKAREHIKYLIANGENTYLWHNIWCSSKPLLEDDQAILLLNMSLTSKVSAIICNQKWSSTINDLLDTKLKNRILWVKINQYLEKDEIVWMPMPLGKFMSKSAYDKLCKPKNKVR